MTQKTNLPNYWALPSADQQSLINEMLPPEEQACECADLSPVGLEASHRGANYAYCPKCGAMFEIITPYVVKRLKTVE